MKTIKNITLIALLMIGFSCTDLDLNPLSQASSETWYKNDTQFEMAVNDLFRSVFWTPDAPEWTDDFVVREQLSPITDGTINSDWNFLSSVWLNKYKGISRANTLLLNMGDNDLPETSKNMYAGNAHFVRASHYSYLVNHWGDVVYYTDAVDLDEAYTLSRTDKEEVLEYIYNDFDEAAAKLPLSYSEKQYATKGTALAMKARTALYHQDWEIARDAAQACIDLGVYELYPDYGELFKSATVNPKEIIFAIPASEEFEVFNLWPGINGLWVAGTLPRNAGGWGNNSGSYELFNAYPCVDGLPIDESPLYDPQNPFENRDPRLSETHVPHGEAHCGYIFQPHPDSVKTLNVETGKYVNNQDTRSVQRYTSYTGLLWKKGVDEYWCNNRRNQNDLVIMRYADVLLMYAEAKIELNEIDQSVLDAINKVRARAYEVNYTETSAYPAVTTTNQDELRSILRVERRVEFAFEGRRYMDIIRWRLAEKVLNKPIYGLLNTEQLRERVVNRDLWFFADTPEIDSDGVSNLGPMYDAGYLRLLSQRNFDESKQYLWPVPGKEIKINENMTQNPGY